MWKRKTQEYCFFRQTKAQFTEGKDKRLNFFVIREMQIKATVKYHFLTYLVGKSPKLWRHAQQARRRAINMLTFWQWECKMLQPLWRGIWQLQAKRHMYLPFDPAITLLGISSTETLAKKQKGIWTRLFISALSERAKCWKQPRSLSTETWWN